MEKLQFRLEQYEGPLDLLLHLISKHKLNIYDIEIFELVKQYMQYLEALEEMDLEVSTEFLEMAARLVYIKSVMLLPKHEEADELRQELTGQLLEYQTVREVAESLREKYVGDRIFVREALELPVNTQYSRVHPPEVLLQAMLAALGKNRRNLPPSQEAFSGIVRKRVVSVSSKILFVLRRLYLSTQAGFASFFAETEDRSEKVATFLAILELIKAKRVTISEDSSVLFFQRGRRDA